MTGERERCSCLFYSLSLPLSGHFYLLETVIVACITVSYSGPDLLPLTDDQLASSRLMDESIVVFVGLASAVAATAAK